MKVFLSSIKGKEIVNDTCENCNIWNTTKVNGEVSICKLSNQRVRKIYRTFPKYSLGFCSDDQDLIKSTNETKRRFEAVAAFAPKINSIYFDYKSKVDRLVHNLRKPIASILQRIDGEIIKHEKSKSLSLIQSLEKDVISEPKKWVKYILEMYKLSSALSIELSAFYKVNKIHKVKKEEIEIHPSTMNIVNPLKKTFEENNLIIIVKSSHEKVLTDYQCYHPVLYSILENTIKYGKPNSEIVIYFLKGKDYLDVKICMDSLLIEENEKEKIFEEKYRGILTSGYKGEGLGLFRARKLMKLMEGELLLNLNEKTSPQFQKKEFIIRHYNKK